MLDPSGCNGARGDDDDCVRAGVPGLVPMRMPAPRAALTQGALWMPGQVPGEAEALFSLRISWAAKTKNGEEGEEEGQSPRRSIK